MDGQGPQKICRGGGKDKKLAIHRDGASWFVSLRLAGVVSRNPSIITETREGGLLTFRFLGNF
jgi:hypothetical protein